MTPAGKAKNVVRPCVAWDQQLLLRLLEFLNSKMGVRSLLIDNEDYLIETPAERRLSAQEIMALR